MTEEIKSKEEEVTPPEGTQVEAPVLKPEETTAVSFGWMPKEKWVESGKSEEDWVPAKHFLRFGEVKQREIAKDKQLQKQDKLIKMMKDHYLTVKDQARDEALRQLREERKDALKANDLTRAEELRDLMEETKEKFAKQPVVPPEIDREMREAAQAPTPQSPPAEFFQFLDRNPWYIADATKQDEISREADALGNAEVLKARRSGREPTLNEVYDAVEKKIKKLFPDKFSAPGSPHQSAPSRKDTKSSGSVKLSDEEMAVAKAFNLTPEKYLESQKGYKGR
jgi:hypothetical protein